MRISILITMIFLYGITSAAGLNQDSPWPKFRHDLKNTGRTQFTGPANPTLAWTFPTNDFIVSSPTIGSDGTIYVGSGVRRGTWATGETDSSLYAINPDGTLKWKYTTYGGVFSSPTISFDGTIYVGSLDHGLYAIEDSVTYGKLKWRTDLGFYVLSSPTVSSDGTIYIGSPSFLFYALEPDGSVRWDYQSGWCIISSPVLIDDSIIYVGSKDHHLYAFNENTQGPIWALPTGTFFDGHLVDASPAVGPDGTIYVGSDPYGAAGHGHLAVPVDTNFWAINPDGTLKWPFPTGDGVESSPAIGADGTIYFGSYDSCFYALADSGSFGFLKWKFTTGGPIDCSPAIDGDGIIYFGSRDSTIYALYPDGSIKWTYNTGGSIESSPTIDDKGYLYFGAFDSLLYAIGTGAPDFGTTAIELPPQVEISTAYNPTAVIRNFRGATDDVDIACTIDSNSINVYSDTISALGLSGGGDSTVVFAPWTIGPDTGVTYDITVTTVLNADENSDNDAATFQLISIDKRFLCGDANGDESINIGDAVFLINYVFKGGSTPDPLESGETNCDGNVNVGDAVYLINYIFKSGSAPCAACP